MGSARGIYNYDGEEFEVTRTSPDSITISLTCEDHKHDEYIVGMIEGHKGWGVGTKTSGGYARDGDTFVEQYDGKVMGIIYLTTQRRVGKLGGKNDIRGMGMHTTCW